MNNSVNRPYLENVLIDLVRTNSINPKLISDGPGEKEIGHLIASLLTEIGVSVHVDTIEGNRSNIIAIIKGSGGGPSLMLNGHMDTVGVDGMLDPFSAEIRNGRLYGRGSQDMKGGLAAMIAAIKGLVNSGIRLKGDVLASFVIDEEFASIGAEAVVNKYKTDAAIVTESTNLNICVAHRGFGVYEITTRGRAAHGGSPAEGIDANLHMGKVLAALDKLSAKLNQSPAHSLLDRPSLHVPLINGGKQIFIYADQCSMHYERRTMPGETEEMIAGEIRAILDDLAAQDDQFKYNLNKVVFREAYEISTEKEIVQLALTATEEVLGKRPPFIGHGWWEDSALFGANGTETIILGPTGEGIHSPVEWVDIQSVADLSRILLSTMISYCKQ